jgi:Leucine-rich repeat (LRR) protein
LVFIIVKDISKMLPFLTPTKNSISQITTLNLSQNLIKSIKANEFFEFRNLQKLILFKNEITRLQKDWSKGLSQLKLLDLSNNRLSSLPNEIFKGLNSLQDLRISNNKFHFTDKANTPFLGLNQLKNLELAENNFLNSIGPNSFKNLKSLQNLWLINSNITVLSIEAFKVPFCSLDPSSPVIIKIADNPIVNTATGILKNTTCYSFILDLN